MRNKNNPAKNAPPLEVIHEFSSYFSSESLWWDIYNSFTVKLANDFIKTGKLSHYDTLSIDGYQNVKEDYIHIVKKVKEIFGEPSMTQSSIHRKNGWNTYYFTGEHFLAKLQLNYKDQSSSEFVCCVTKEGLKKKIYVALKPHFKERSQNSVYVISQSARGFTLINLGEAGEELKEENYSSSVLREYKELLSELNKKEPAGRFALLYGAPGTGKTYLIRNLISAVKAKFILVPSQLVEHLDSPSFVSVLMEEREFEDPLPLILILEDADDCLIPRMSDNISSIRSLLNISDGIFGTILDMRVIATTNAKEINIEAALLRAGRLCASINVGKLSVIEAAKTYKSLTNKDMVFEKEKTLAEVYEIAKKGSTKNSSIINDSTVKIGF